MNKDLVFPICWQVYWTSFRIIRKEAMNMIVLHLILGSVGIFIAGAIVILMLYCLVYNKSDVDRERKDREQIEFLRELNEKKKLRQATR